MRAPVLTSVIFCRWVRIALKEIIKPNYMCKTIVLSSGEHTAISHCPCCKVYYVWHNNLVLSFSGQEFLSFREIIENASFTETSLPFPDKKERILLRSPNEDISFAFTSAELEDFRSMLNEAIYMKEVYTLMGTEPGTR